MECGSIVGMLEFLLWGTHPWGSWNYSPRTPWLLEAWGGRQEGCLFLLQQPAPLLHDTEEQIALQRGGQSKSWTCIIQPRAQGTDMCALCFLLLEVEEEADICCRGRASVRHQVLRCRAARLCDKCLKYILIESTLQPRFTGQNSTLPCSTLLCCSYRACWPHRIRSSLRAERLLVCASQDSHFLEQCQPHLWRVVNDLGKNE